MEGNEDAFKDLGQKYPPLMMLNNSKESYMNSIDQAEMVFGSGVTTIDAALYASPKQRERWLRLSVLPMVENLVQNRRFCELCHSPLSPNGNMYHLITRAEGAFSRFIRSYIEKAGKFTPRINLLRPGSTKNRELILKAKADWKTALKKLPLLKDCHPKLTVTDDQWGPLKVALPGMPQLLLEDPKDLLREIKLEFADDLEIPGDYISRLTIKRLAIWRRHLLRFYRPINAISGELKSKYLDLAMHLQQLDRLAKELIEAADKIENFLADDPNRAIRDSACILLQVYLEYAEKPNLVWLSEHFREKTQSLIQRWFVRNGNIKIGSAIQRAMAMLKPLVKLRPEDFVGKYPLVAQIDGGDLRIWHKKKKIKMNVGQQPGRMFWALLLHTAAGVTPQWGNCKSRIRNWKSRLIKNHRGIKPLLLKSDSTNKVRLKYSAEDIRLLTPQGIMTEQSILENAKRVLGELCPNSN